MIKKLIAGVSAAFMLIPFIQIPKAEALNFTLKTPLQSESAILVNLDCDTVIHEKNADAKQVPGPLVNIMSVLRNARTSTPRSLSRRTFFPTFMLPNIPMTCALRRFLMKTF